MRNKQKKLLKDYRFRTERYWLVRGNNLSLRLFKSAAKRVFAYKKFLKKSKVQPSRIHSFKDLAKVPLMSKKNYFRKFALSEVTWPGLLLKQGQVMTATSGSTGAPTYFPRNEAVDINYSLIAEFFLNNGLGGSTLLIDAFGMGVWIGGLITYQAFREAALRGSPVTILTPGINKKEIFHALRELAPSFQNVILAGYPPFLKDIIDEAAEERVDFRKFSLRLLFAAESFTENFRDYVVRKARVRSPYFDTMNLYGSAELGAMAFETPGAIFIRRLALKHAEIYEELFNNKKIPTLAQYDSSFIAFEENEGQILITADSAVPFVRYAIGDNGGVFSLSQIEAAFLRNGVYLKQEAVKARIPLLPLPFVYVYERSDFSTTLYGLQIYPQTIKLALESRKLQAFLTGKFAMKAIYDKKSNQFLEINVELKPRVAVTKQISSLTDKNILEMLLHHNSEFRELTKMLSIKRTKPKIVFWPYNHDAHFKSGIKQQWLKK